ncbi:uncharacterized protein BT62DRAFT_1001172 [Guyanagaster necrorhizus]|uniref:ER membrane protein complex subunit 7 beta-sandwich domain-containing protein n=1 Tax=Guyanagaster necrorhizus TaxID=856835 RepID=A0A9P8AW72_9AGAR|nr:uncharacterized protein BT62DRAFT_1001172 [Guyanagaster necrorhizus MCA 3950]KAG7450334.1 hypothetical protein BT62DRAFT_1001172 [Guyanagaster necrorhizus MCA 3950]
MIPFILHLLGILSLLFPVHAVDVIGRLQWNDVCPGLLELGPSKVVLDNGRRSGNVVQDGSFTIYDVPTGTYILSVLTHDFVFDQLRIDVLQDAIVEVRPYLPGTPLNPPVPNRLQYPLALTPRTKHKYFVPPDSFNMLGMLKSPMVLMMVFTGAMVLAMPYLMKNMDPEALEEFKEQQAKVAKMQSAMTNGDFKSGFSALLPAGDEAPKETQSSSTSTGTSKGSQGSKTRGKKRK